MLSVPAWWLCFPETLDTLTELEVLCMWLLGKGCRPCMRASLSYSRVNMSGDRFETVVSGTTSLKSRCETVLHSELFPDDEVVPPVLTRECEPLEEWGYTDDELFVDVRPSPGKGKDCVVWKDFGRGFREGRGPGGMSIRSSSLELLWSERAVARFS